MKKAATSIVLTRKDIERLRNVLPKLRAEVAARYDSQDVDCCEQSLNLLEARHG